MKNKHEILAIYANDFGKAFDFVRKEVITECVEIVRTEPDIIFGPGIHHDTYPSMRQRMVDKMKKLGPVE